MLINTLNECIIDMKTVRELETASADTKKQVSVDYNFKQLVESLKQKIIEINIAVTNSEFIPSSNVVSALKSFLGSCDKIIQTGAANNTTTTYIDDESKKIYTTIEQEWIAYYTKSTENILNLLDTVKVILPNEEKAKFTVNKIKKAASWNKTAENYNYLKQGLTEAKQILNDFDLDGNSNILAFLKLVSDGNATIVDLTDEIIVWIKAENLAHKMFIRF